MVERYWRKVKAKFGQLANNQAAMSSTSQRSGQSLSRSRSLSPYDPDGNNNRSRQREPSPMNALGTNAATHTQAFFRSQNNHSPRTDKQSATGVLTGNSLGRNTHLQLTSNPSSSKLTY